MRTIKHVLMNIGLVLVSIVITLGLVETALRLAGYHSLYAGTQFFKYDAILGWRLQPNQEGPFQRPQFNTYVKINRHGFRGVDHDYGRITGRKRILVLGDSFVWGYGVNDDQVFARLMEASLPRTEVINAGVTAYGSAQELLWLEREGVKYDPDLVILLFFRNDCIDNVTPVYHGYHRPVMELGPDGSLRLSGVPCSQGSLKERIRKWVVRNSAVTGLLLRLDLNYLLALESLFVETPEVRGAATADHPGSPREQDAVRLTAALIERMRQVVESKGGRFLVASLCHGDEPCEQVVQQLLKHKAPLLSVDRLPGYRRNEMIIEGDEHWNAAGHRFVAESILAFIKDNHLLD